MNRYVAGAVAALLFAVCAQAGTTVTPAAVAERIGDPQTAPLLLDVRTAQEFGAGHVPGAVNIPVQELESRLAQVPKDREVVVYCEVGGRARRAGTLLRERGYDKVSEMEGSMKAWREARLPVEK